MPTLPDTLRHRGSDPVPPGVVGLDHWTVVLDSPQHGPLHRRLTSPYSSAAGTAASSRYVGLIRPRAT